MEAAIASLDPETLSAMRDSVSDAQEAQADTARGDTGRGTGGRGA